jgi:hypothetical protein
MCDVCVFALWPIFKQNPPSSDSENEPAIISSSIKIFVSIVFISSGDSKLLICII